ncbi:hypothetical protein diail_9647 [Diaporthe ilicicola]|nr:hypothetical protein diail_9647 [Diaporthe ilicicola]
MALPAELIYIIIRNIIDTPAVFIFDVDISTPPQPPQPAARPQSRHISFRPCVSPPNGQGTQAYFGTYESQVSKTIRSLLLTNRHVRDECLSHLQGIAVPHAGGHAVVHFNPRRHIICLQHVTMSPPPPSQHPPTFWANRNTNLATNFNFEIDHLAFLYTGLMDWRYEAVAVFRRAFPTLQHFYGAQVNRPRGHPSKPLELVCPTRDPGHGLSPALVYIAKRSWKLVRQEVLQSPSFRSRWGVIDNDQRRLAFTGMILI